MAELHIGSHRRYCFLKYKQALAEDSNLDSAWDAKRRELPGTTLPATFPSRAALVAAGYLVTEEVEGATDRELQLAGLTAQQSAAVQAAVE